MRSKGMARLEESVPGLVFTSYVGVHPVQAEGTLHSMPFYFRHRSGPATLNLGEPDGPPPYGGKDSLYSSSYDGSLDSYRTEDFVLMFRELVKSLERSAWIWTFEGAEVKGIDNGLQRTGRLTEYSASAHTVEEALAQVLAPEPPKVDRVWLALHLPREASIPEGFSPEAYWDLVSLSETPLNRDTRKFPAEAPPFEVLPLGEQ